MKTQVIIDNSSVSQPTVHYVNAINKAVAIFEKRFAVSINDVTIRLVEKCEHVTYLDGDEFLKCGHYNHTTKTIVMEMPKDLDLTLSLTYHEASTLFHELAHHCQVFVWKTLSYTKCKNIVTAYYDGAIDNGPYLERRHEREARLLADRAWIAYDRQIREEENKSKRDAYQKMIEEREKAFEERVKRFWKYFAPVSIVMVVVLVTCLLSVTLLHQLCSNKSDLGKTEYKTRAEFVIEHGKIQQAITDLQTKIEEARSNGWSDLQSLYEQQSATLQSDYNERAQQFNKQFRK